MNKLWQIMICVLVLGLAAPARSDDLTDRIVEQLQEQGFDRINVSRTFLGRTRVEAESSTHHREIVINPVSGEIMRDYWEARTSTRTVSPNLMDPKPEKSRGKPSHQGKGGNSGPGGNSGSSGDDDASDDASDDAGDDDAGDDDGGNDSDSSGPGGDDGDSGDSDE